MNSRFAIAATYPRGLPAQRGGVGFVARAEVEGGSVRVTTACTRPGIGLDGAVLLAARGGTSAPLRGWTLEQLCGNESARAGTPRGEAAPGTYRLTLVDKRRRWSVPLGALTEGADGARMLSTP